MTLAPQPRIVTVSQLAQGVLAAVKTWTPEQKVRAREALLAWANKMERKE